VDRVRSLRARFPGAAGPVVGELQMLYNRRVDKYKASRSG
jgi:hypothetical protein